MLLTRSLDVPKTFITKEHEDESSSPWLDTSLLAVHSIIRPCLFQDRSERCASSFPSESVSTLPVQGDVHVGRFPTAVPHGSRIVLSFPSLNSWPPDPGNFRGVGRITRAPHGGGNNDASVRDERLHSRVSPSDSRDMPLLSSSPVAEFFRFDLWVGG